MQVANYRGVRDVLAGRRAFLRGKAKSAGNAPRPPWALAGGAFESRCTRCGDCLAACPSRILVVGEGGYPTVDFARGECTFCGDCVARCGPGALCRQGDDAPWSLMAMVTEGCLAERGVECRVCGEACLAGAIGFQPRIGGMASPVVQASACTGCGACVSVCPTGSVKVGLPEANLP